MIDKSYAVIMAGGSGTRFWPLSRRGRPKQFLRLGPNNHTLLRATAERAWSLIPAERTLVVTSEALGALVAEELPELPDENILREPVGRNTAPCVGWAAVHVQRRDPDALMAVLPADHYVGNAEAYAATLRRCLEAAEHGDLVTIGIRPTRAETGYGYVEAGPELSPGVYRARRFVEKPNRQRAEQFLSSGRFLWNSGMFFFQASRILEAIGEHLPGLGTQLTEYANAGADGEPALVSATYASLPSISIDHGVMEKGGDVSVAPADFEWSDLGSWASVWELAERDELDNVLPKGAVTIDTEGVYARTTDGKLIALLGVKDLVIVDTEDALMIAPRERSQEVRALVKKLNDREDTHR